jgi:hypothetical protein
MTKKNAAMVQRDRATFLYFRKRLALRLMVAVVLCTIGAGVGAFFIETERLDETLVDQAAQEAQLFRRSLIADHRARSGRCGLVRGGLSPQRRDGVCGDG